MGIGPGCSCFYLSVEQNSVIRIAWRENAHGDHNDLLFLSVRLEKSGADYLGPNDLPLVLPESAVSLFSRSRCGSFKNAAISAVSTYTHTHVYEINKCRFQRTIIFGRFSPNEQPSLGKSSPGTDNNLQNITFIKIVNFSDFY